MNRIRQEYDKNVTEAYGYEKMQVLAIQHGLQSWVAYPQLTRNAEVPVSGQGLFYLFLVHVDRAGSGT